MISIEVLQNISKQKYPLKDDLPSLIVLNFAEGILIYSGNSVDN